MKSNRWIVLFLAATLAAFGVYGWISGHAPPSLLAMLGFGVVLAVLYVVRGGSLPDVVHRHVDIARDDDPRNLSPRLYLPILLAAVLVAATLFWWTTRR